jgi:hypothetical protein
LVSPDPQVSVRHQCELLEVCRSSYYYQCCPESQENLALMRRLDEMHLEHPAHGSRKLTVLLRREGLGINRERVVRLLRLMGIEAIYAKPRTSLQGPGHQIYPYLLRDLEVTGPDQVWCSDITYVPMATGFMYLVAVMDWWSRYVLGVGYSLQDLRATPQRRCPQTLQPPPARPVRRRPANQSRALAPATALSARNTLTTALIPLGPATRPPARLGTPAPHQGRIAIKLHGRKVQNCPRPNSKKIPRPKLTKLPLNISPLLPVSPPNQMEKVHGKSEER